MDLFLFDVKDTDDKRHIRFTGMSNRKILSNLRALHDHGANIRLRLPLIPGFNDHEGHFAGIASLVGALPNLHGVEIMPYHNLGADKDRRLGLSREAALPDGSVGTATLCSWIDRLGALGVNVVNAPHMKKNGPMPNRV